jgi:hypothetical protein
MLELYLKPSAAGRTKMSRTRTSVIGILCAVMGTSALCAADLSSYRGLKLGMSLAAAAKQAGTKPSEARLVQQRPAIIQEVNWELRSPVQANPKPDPVKDGLLSFFNGELFRIIVTYDRYKVEGMTAEDLIQVISATYGPAAKPTAEIAYHSNYAEVAPVLARWEDSENSYDLVRTGDRSSFALVLYSKRLETLALASIVEAARLDAQEAPQREIDKQKKRDEADNAALDKARAVNKPNFRP